MKIGITDEPHDKCAKTNKNIGILKSIFERYLYLMREQILENN